jgi:integrase
LKAIDEITGGGDYVFSCDGGKTPIHIAYLNDVAKAICATMQEAGELEGTPFTAGTIRATIETRLIAKPYSVSSDVLAHLLSHGMGGIQQRHYQHHDFFDEKLDALQKLHGMLTQPRGKVTAIRGRARA